MWVRLSEADAADADAAEALRRRQLRGPLLTAGIMALLLIVLSALGYRGSSMRSGIIVTGEQRSLADPALLIVFGFVFAATFAMAYWRQRRTGRSLLGDAPSVICATCHEIAAEGALTSCSCGGNWEPIRRWTWASDEGETGA